MISRKKSFTNSSDLIHSDDACFTALGVKCPFDLERRSIEAISTDDRHQRFYPRPYLSQLMHQRRCFHDVICLLIILGVMITMPVKAELSWSPIISTLSQGNYDANSPQVMSSGPSQAMAVWRKSNGNTWVIEGSQYSLNGWGFVNTNISSPSVNAYYPSYPRGITSPTAFWVSDSLGVVDIQFSQQSGGRWSLPTTIGSALKNSPVTPYAVGANAFGKITAGWMTNQFARQKLTVAISSEGWYPQYGLSDNIPTAISVAVSKYGNSTILWEETGNIFSTRQESGYFVFFGGILLSPGRNPSVAVDDNGNATALWTVIINNRGVIQSARVLNDRWQGAWSNSTNLSSVDADSDRAALFVSPNGDAVAVWQGKSTISCCTTIQASRFVNGIWLPATTISNPIQGEFDKDAQVTSDSAGNQTAVWSHIDKAGNSKIQAAHFSNGSWGAVTDITDSVGQNSAPQIASDASSNVYVLWTHFGNGPSTIQAKTAARSLKPTFTLTINKSGNGRLVSAPSGIDCGPQCQISFQEGTQVTLSAVPDSGYSFSGWGGDCSGKSVCTLTMNAQHAVTATFSPNTTPTQTLSVNKIGHGVISSSPHGILCGSACSAPFQEGIVVTLFNSPDPGSIFSGWSGGCSGTGACMVKMSVGRTVTATFVEGSYPPPYARLTVAVTKGQGTIVSSPQGIDCGQMCSYNFTKKSKIQIIASPSSGNIFKNWVGGGCGKKNPCTLNMTANKSVKAVFQ